MKNRRDFIKTVAAFTSGLMIPIGASGSGKKENRDKYGEILPLRLLGNTGEKVTMLGAGGYHIGWTTERDAQEVIEAAMEGGIRFFDTAQSYEDGLSEERYGKFLVPKYRDQVFLMTKTLSENGQVLLKEFDLSLKRLKCDYVDLLQVHSLRTPDDVDQRIENGVIEAMLKILESGKARHIGFTGHQNPLANLRMLERLPEFPHFSTTQMPINLVDYASQHSFVKSVLPKAIDKGLGVLAMKTLADGRFFNRKESRGEVKWKTETPIIPNYINIQEALFFVWSLPVSVLITGAENATMLREKISLAKAFVALSEEERMKLLEKAQMAPNREQVEYYKQI